MIHVALDELKCLHKEVSLFVDALRINKILFLHAISATLGVRTLQALADRFKESLLQFLKDAFLFCKNNDFEVKLIGADLEFK